MDYTVSLRSFTPRRPSDGGLPAFRLEIFHSSLEVCPVVLHKNDHRIQYTQYEELLTTTISGFVSELGDQSNLFIGLSVETVVQLLVSVVLFFYRKTSHLLRLLGINTRCCFLC